MFTLGQTVMTRGVLAHCDEFPGTYIDIITCVTRHASGDWGDMCAEDKAENDRALKENGRLMSAYTVSGKKIWIITEWDRSVTTVLLPEEY